MTQLRIRPNFERPDFEGLNFEKDTTSNGPLRKIPKQCISIKKLPILKDFLAMYVNIRRYTLNIILGDNSIMFHIMIQYYFTKEYSNDISLKTF